MMSVYTHIITAEWQVCKALLLGLYNLHVVVPIPVPIPSPVPIPGIYNFGVLADGLSAAVYKK